MDKELIIGYWSVIAIQDRSAKRVIDKWALYKVNNDDNIDFAYWHTDKVAGQSSWQKQNLSLKLVKYGKEFYFSIDGKLEYMVQSLKDDSLVLDHLLSDKKFVCKRIKEKAPINPD